MLFRRKKKTTQLKYADCTAVIVAAGSSERMGGQDKQFAIINGIPVLAHTLMVFQESPYIREIVIVVKEDKFNTVTELCLKYNIVKAASIVKGGKTRLESVMNGVLTASKKANYIAVHDGARPCVTSELIQRVMISACENQAAAPAIPITSTIKQVKNEQILKTINREGLYEVQTPQIFSSDIIKAALTNAYEKGINVTDDCMAVEALGMKVHITEGAHENIKITRAGDIKIASAVLSQEEN